MVVMFLTDHRRVPAQCVSYSMLEWLQHNLPALNGSVVALMGVFRPLLDWFMDDPRIRRVRKYADICAALVEGAEEAGVMDDLLADEVRDLSKRSLRRRSRRLDVGTIAAILFVSIGAGFGSYWLTYGVQSATGIVSTLLWLVFWVWTGVAIFLVLVGGQVYKNKTRVSA